MKKYYLLIAFVLAFFMQTMQAQEARTITGTITDPETNEPLVGVNVVVKGSTIGTVTNVDGKYTIKLPAGASFVEVRYVGYETKVLPVDEASNVLDVALAEDVIGLSDVVVTALGIKREKKALGYAVQEVKGDELTQSGEVNFVQGLASKVAGVQVIGSGGTPGASSKILLRGNSTFTGENQPLIVVDGVPISNETKSLEGRDNPFNANLAGVNHSNRALDINPDDIESLNVLKGPAAAALYGVRAGNGAIVITTKKGSKGKVKVDYSVSVDVSEVNKLPELQDTYAQGTGGGGQIDDDGNPITPFFDTYDPGPDGIGFTADDVSFGTSESWGPTLSSLGLTPTDNIGNFFQKGLSQSHNLAISGGNNNTTFRLSLGHVEQEGIIPNTDFRRTSIRLTSETSLTDKIKVFGTANYIKSGGTKIQNGSNLSGAMLSLTRTPASFDLLGGGGEADWERSDGNQHQYFIVYDNPQWSARENPFTDDINRFIGNLSAKWQATPWLDFTYRVGTDAYTDQRKQVFAIGAWDPPNPTGQIEENTVRYREVYSDFLIRASHSLTDKISGNITLGNNLNHREDQNLYARGRNLSIPDFYNLDNASDRYASNLSSVIRTAALFFNVDLEYNRMLYLNVTGRNEWSSTFGPNQNNFFYPSASASFVFSELLPETDIFSFGKVRYAFAQAGISPEEYTSQTYFVAPFFTDGFTDGISFPFLGQSGFGYSTRLGNEDLKPELITGNEIGVDVRFLKGRIGLDVTVYDQKTTDILVNRPVAASTGFEFATVNSGELQNRGIELIATGKVVKKPNFTWDVMLNYSTNETKVLALAPGVDEINIETAFSSIGSFAIKDQVYGALYGTQWERTDDGQLIIGANGLPTVADERGNIGNPFPDWIGSLRNTFNIKGIGITALLDVREGGKVWCGTCARLNRLGRTAESADRERTYIIDGVKADGTANDIEISAYDYFQRFVGDAGAAVEQAVFDGSWVRLRELGVNYNLKNLNIPVLKNISLSFTGRNLWLKTDYPGVDPETSLTGAGSNVTGFDYFNNPGTRSYIFGLKASF